MSETPKIAKYYVGETVWVVNDGKAVKRRITLCELGVVSHEECYYALDYKSAGYPESQIRPSKEELLKSLEELIKSL